MFQGLLGVAHGFGVAECGLNSQCSPLCSAHKVASMWLNTWSLQMPWRPSANAAWQTFSPHFGGSICAVQIRPCRGHAGQEGGGIKTPGNVSLTNASLSFELATLEGKHGRKTNGYQMLPVPSKRCQMVAKG